MDSVLISCEGYLWLCTDSTGSYMFKGMYAYIPIFRDNRMRLTFEKTGYKTVKKRFRNYSKKSHTILMKKND